MKFVQRLNETDEAMAELCREFGVSRKTGYKWLRRYEAGGVTALADRSRAPQRQANATPDEQVQAVLQARGLHRRWGPEKLRAWLIRKHPEQRWPSASTMGEILKRAGLTVVRGNRLWVTPTPGRVVYVKFSNLEIGRQTVSVPAGAARRDSVPAGTAHSRQGREAA